MTTSSDKINRKELDAYVEKWKQAGLELRQADKPRAEAAVKDLYRRMGEKEPIVVWCGSPAAAIISYALAACPWPDDDSATCVYNKLVSAFGKAVMDNLPMVKGDGAKKSKKKANVSDEAVVEASPADQFQLGAAIARFSAPAGDETKCAAGYVESVRRAMEDALNNLGYAQTEAGYYAYFEYLRQNGQTEGSDMVEPFIELSRSCGFFLCEATYCWLTECIQEIHLDAQGRPHNLNGPAFAFADGLKFYLASGVEIEPWIAETPADSVEMLDLIRERFGKIRSVEVRRELLRKVGTGKIVEALDAKVLDKLKAEWDNTPCEYILYSVNLGEGVPNAKVLQMDSVSLPGVRYIEFVRDECETVLDAIEVRNGVRALPISLS